MHYMAQRADRRHRRSPRPRALAAAAANIAQPPRLPPAKSRKRGASRLPRPVAAGHHARGGGARGRARPDGLAAGSASTIATVRTWDLPREVDVRRGPAARARAGAAQREDARAFRAAATRRRVLWNAEAPLSRFSYALTRLDGGDHRYAELAAGLTAELPCSSRPSSGCRNFSGAALAEFAAEYLGGLQKRRGERALDDLD